LNVPLDLKYRPKKFDDMFQPHIVKALKNSIKYQRIPNTLIFTGWTGIGKTSLARLYAMALNCQNLSDDQEPCGSCESCKRIAQSTSMDVEEINVAEKTGIDDVRRMIDEKYHLMPVLGKYRVFLLDEAHCLSSQGQNALLKPLEEAPDHVVFILCTTEVDKIIDTISCRAQEWSFDRVSEEVLTENLEKICQQENFEYSAEALKMIAMVSDGSPRKSIKLLEQICSDEINVDNVETILKITPRALSLDILLGASSGNIEYLINIVDILNSQGKNLILVLKQLSLDVSNLIRFIAGVKLDVDPVSISKMESILKNIPQKSLKKRIRKASKVIISLFEAINYRNVAKDLVLTNGLIDLSLALRDDEFLED